MRKLAFCLIVSAALCGAPAVHAAPDSAAKPGCERDTAKECVERALEAMGGRGRLEAVKNVRLTLIGHTLLMEQSYRQAPFIASYERATRTLDFAGLRTLTESHVTWPESDPGQAEINQTVVTGPAGGVTRTKEADGPCSRGAIDEAAYDLALGPARLLLTASQASDLHFDAPQTLRYTAHAVVAFTWNGIPVRILLNQFNHLPDAVEATRTFKDFWYFWGDVRERVYLDNWQRFSGISYPTNRVDERNGAEWRSTQILGVEFNVPTDELKTFAMDATMAGRSAAGAGWNRPFRAEAAQITSVAPGVDVILGAWNSTIVRQADGIVLLEAPISGRYTQGVLDLAASRNPGASVKAVLSTSDSWPHVGGVRQAVADGYPIYILDLNQPLLDRFVTAPHTIEPDALGGSTAAKAPAWKIVSEKTVIGEGDNRVELYPLRGASTERQYMVYFPKWQLLYASDTLAISDDGSLYDPELMHEVAQAVQRENLTVKTVFAMHQAPIPWEKVLTLLGS
jgi:hypothetical protein